MTLTAIEGLSARPDLICRDQTQLVKQSTVRRDCCQGQGGGRPDERYSVDGVLLCKSRRLARDPGVRAIPFRVEVELGLIQSSPYQSDGSRVRADKSPTAKECQRAMEPLYTG
jgi:hypothetical protein